MPYYFEKAYNKYRLSVFDTPSHYADCQDQINSFAEDIMNWMEINWGIDYVDPLNNDYKKASSNIEYYESHVPNKHDNSRLGQWLFQFHGCCRYIQRGLAFLRILKIKTFMKSSRKYVTNQLSNNYSYILK